MGKMVLIKVLGGKGTEGRTVEMVLIKVFV